MKKPSQDHRTRVTKMLIRDAFTKLLLQKPIQSISIKELCDLAGINRGTFYTHYVDIYDLRNQMEEEMFADFQEALEPVLHAGQLTPLKVTTGIFQCIRDNSDLCAVTLGDYGDKRFLWRLIDWGREVCMEAYTKYFANAASEKIAAFYIFASAGCIGLLQEWFRTGLHASAEEIAEMADGLMHKGIAFLES